MPTKIEWCDESLNIVAGCSKCSPGCDHCYAEVMARRLSKMPKTAALYAGVVDEGGRWTGEMNSRPLSVFNRLPRKSRSVFVGSMTDLFHSKNRGFVPAILCHTASLPQHKFIFLTKRPDEMKASLEEYRQSGLAVPDNAWFGVTVCNQKEVDEKIPILTSIPSIKRFISMEPLLGKVDIRLWDSDHLPSDEEPFQEKQWLIHGVIVGGETGPRARPMHPDWVRSLRDQCAIGVPFFFKGWGAWKPITNGHDLAGVRNKPREYVNFCDGEISQQCVSKVGKKSAGRLLDGVEHNERSW